LIYVKRDPDLIPEKILKVAERAQAELEKLPANERVAFIKKKSHIWRAFKRHLAKMSHGKCWYSESPDPQSFFDVDHFRPKAEARRDDVNTDDGYPWLAFSWDNFRFSAGRSNRASTDEDTEETVGKGSWFPLMAGSPVATWDDRCTNDELPILLDPIVQADVDLLKVDVTDNLGAICGSELCLGPNAKLRVAKTIELYGLNLPALVSARKRAMREVQQSYEILGKLMEVAGVNDAAADALPLAQIVEQLRARTRATAPYSKAARVQLWCMGAGAFCAQPEDVAEFA
jgi:hypothetical protein